MRIAQIAPLTESVPPRLYGGTERVVSYLTEELVRRGHDVTLFASGDSVTGARLIPGALAALRFDTSVRDPLPSQLLQLEQIRQRTQAFDVMHFHTDLLHFPLFRPLAERTLTTLHGRLDLPDLAPFYQEFNDMPVVSLSRDQRRAVPQARWMATIPHGLPRAITRFHAQPDGRYLVFLGRISPEKRPDRAIAIARRAGMRLRIAAKVDRADQAYFERDIRPLLAHPLIEWVGEISDSDKPALLGEALALLFPIDWPEPFGLVMIEAMAAGTPTIAFRCGSVPEVIEHGLSGLIVDDEDSAVAAVKRVHRLDRRQVRARFEQRFTIERMADAYLRVYRTLAQRLRAGGRDRERYAWN